MNGSDLVASTPPNSAQEEADVVNAVVDDPCWGTPSSCSLKHLLKLLSRHSSILLESKDYLVLNKPPDLRMDGPFPATVHKLLTYWYPPASMSQQLPQSSAISREDDLLSQIRNLHSHGDVLDNELRPCHQLDYATSGVLLVARSSSAANRAREMFESRHPDLQKRYLALVHGHVDYANQMGLPELAAHEIQSRISALEDAHRKVQRKRYRKPGTFQGYQPPHALFQQWYQQQQQHPEKLARQRLPELHSVHGERKRRRHRKSFDRFTPAQWQEIWSSVTLTDLKEQLDQHPERWMTWADVKCHDSYRSAFEQAAQVYNALLLQQSTSAAPARHEDLALPPVFRDHEGNLYVFAPLAEQPDAFAMRIPAEYTSCALEKNDAGKDMRVAISSSRLLVGDETTLEYKPALTLCRVVSRSFLVGSNSGLKFPVTKVELVPKTGRRHQLRVHMAVLGHPIVGDQTYGWGSSIDPAGLLVDDQHPICSRMCLHSASLSLPGLHVAAPDPFRQDGDHFVVQML
jgi:23S rRNA-/tRNA-specific pseudouridylate synthase